jgi:hypothetical protein
MQTLNLDYYSDTFAGAVLQTQELLDIARKPHRSNVEYRHRLLLADRECTKCRAKHWIEERVKSSTKQNPKFRCCGDGRLVIPAPGPYPATLHRQRRAPDADTLSRRAILAPYNEVVVALNKTLLESMPGAQSAFLFVDQCAAHCAAAYPTEFLHAIDVPELPPHELRLKVGCPVLLLRNLDPSNGLCNGTRLASIALVAIS